MARGSSTAAGASADGGTDPRMLITIRDRLYADFVMPSRLSVYRSLVETALAGGYEILSIEALWQRVRGDGLDPARRYLALRHDVDTDAGTAAAMWRIDRELGVRSSYYFRLSTIAPALMHDVGSAGGEASYHYEELATIAKRRGIGSAAELEAHLPEARAEFASNLEALRSRTGLPMRVVSAHGDFVNRRLGVANWALLADPGFRSEVDIDAEAYDPEVIGSFTSQFTDVPHPRYWSPADPLERIRDRDRAVFVLVHPRHWQVDRLGNLRDDIGRALEGAQYGLATRRKGLA
jgi:hypothetical protein